MARHIDEYIAALDELRALVSELDNMVEGGTEQLRAVAGMNSLTQRLISAARLELHKA